MKAVTKPASLDDAGRSGVNPEPTVQSGWEKVVGLAWGQRWLARPMREGDPAGLPAPRVRDLRGFLSVQRDRSKPVAARHRVVAGTGLSRGCTTSGRASAEGHPRGAARLAAWIGRRLEILLIPVAMVAITGLWAAIVQIGNYPTFLLPAPRQVWERFIAAASDGTLWFHTSITLVEILGGLGLGLVTAILLGYLLAKAPLVERFLSPYIVASQSVPIVALAPLLIVWFGFGIASKVLVCALTIFFPVLINTVVGLRSVEPDLNDLLRTLEASRWQVFRYLEVPAALPVLLAGLKVGATLSVIGSVVGEFAQSDRGLGFLVNLANRGLFDTPLMFVALFVLMTIALALYGIVSVVEGLLLGWNRRR